jgi:aryl carrier-like protein
VTPRSELEEKLARIWTELLRLEQVGVHDNFFDLGGHSLLAVKLIARIEQVLGERVALVTLFQAPTIRELAAILSGQKHPGQVPGVVPIHAVGSKAPFFWVGATPQYRPLGQRLASGQPFLGLHLQPSQVGQLSFPYKLEELDPCNLLKRDWQRGGRSNSRPRDYETLHRHCRCRRQNPFALIS